VAGLSLAGVDKSFGAARAVDGVSLLLAPGELVAVLGPSGCGKTTLLRLIAGFETVDAGRIELDGTLLSAPGHHVPAERRGIGIVFQNYALWPHMTVGRNVAYPLEVRGVSRAGRAKRVAAALERVGLGGFAERRPAELSGGQRQRVALARCLVMEAKLVLLDEPLSSLDAHLRASLQDAFDDFHRLSGAEMLYITHDQTEAMALADRIAVMDQGRLVQIAPPPVLYYEPATEMVAGFVGKGGTVEVRVTAAAERGRAPISLLGYPATVRCAPAQKTGRARLFLRPEDLRLAASGEPGFAATVRRLRYRGGVVDFEIALEGMDERSLIMSAASPTAIALGQRVTVVITDGWIVPAG
jgi:iron(III) transport system ATP-binding protein